MWFIIGPALMLLALALLPISLVQWVLGIAVAGLAIGLLLRWVERSDKAARARKVNRCDDTESDHR